eukprot:SM000059S18734  [mRNA]  locus=s59:629989:632745:- [translate_table: standard]
MDHRLDRTDQQGAVHDRRPLALPQLLSYDTAPVYQHGNEYVRRYYRSSRSLRGALLSTFGIHNETLNIWTHLGGFLLFVGLTFHTAACKWPVLLRNPAAETAVPHLAAALSDDVAEALAASRTTYLPKWPVYVFLGGAMACLLSSSLCHILHCHSQALSTLLWKLDYAGIAVMIATSFFPPVYYGFMCEWWWRSFYLVAITALAGATVVLSLWPKFATPPYRPFRATIFVCLGLSGVIPCAHNVLHLWDEPITYRMAAQEAAMGAIYIIGAIVYSQRVPERWFPGKVDLVGQSHQPYCTIILGSASLFGANQAAAPTVTAAAGQHDDIHCTEAESDGRDGDKGRHY